MTPRRFLLLSPLLALLLLALGCDDDGGDGGPSDSPSATERQTPDADSTPIPEGGVILQTDVAEFRTQFGEVIDTTPPCAYDQNAGAVDCTEWDADVYQLDQPLTGEGVKCRAMLVSFGVVGVNCQTSSEPLLNADYALPDYNVN